MAQNEFYSLSNSAEYSQIIVTLFYKIPKEIMVYSQDSNWHNRVRHFQMEVGFVEDKQRSYAPR